MVYYYIEINPDAKKYDQVSYIDVLTKDLKVMDATAISLARENDIPIMVFSVKEEGCLSGLISILILIEHDRGVIFRYTGKSTSAE